MKTSPITLLAHPNSLRLSPGRPSFVTEAGIEKRVSEGRGLGKGADYAPWLCCTDFSSAGYRRMAYSQKLGRIVHLLSDLEWRAFLVAEFDHCVIDIQENYPLHRTKTRKIAKRLGIRHPAPFVDDIVMTTDLYLTIQTPEGPRHIAWYIKHVRAAKKRRAQELLAIEREYHRTNRPPVRLLEITEESFPRVLTDNLMYVRGALRPPSGLEKSVVDEAEARMRLSVHCTPLADVCNETDRSLGLLPGTSLLLARHYIASQRWKVNMFRPIIPHLPLQWEIAS